MKRRISARRARAYDALLREMAPELEHFYRGVRDPRDFEISPSSPRNDNSDPTRAATPSEEQGR